MRLSIIFLLVIFFPLIQKQWLNLYLFDAYNFTIYKFLYYLSGIIVPGLVIIYSLKEFTYYKFNFHKLNNNTDTSGKRLFFITSIISILLSTLISSYIFINIKLLLNLFIRDNDYLVQFDIYKQIITVVIISILLILNKTKYFMKKIILINFFILSIISWYSQINNILLINIAPFNIFKFENINFINICYLLAIETVYYVWSYISYGYFLSDWRLPRPHKKEVLSILNILIFYLLIILYYSLLLS